ncbi:MAG: hypothetical protein JXK95_02720 [Bacteroidales bacterium]|nr:hypothetical protein [Bacteroidales bacterium]
MKYSIYRFINHMARFVLLFAFSVLIVNSINKSFFLKGAAENPEILKAGQMGEKKKAGLKPDSTDLFSNDHEVSSDSTNAENYKSSKYNIVIIL